MAQRKAIARIKADGEDFLLRNDGIFSGDNEEEVNFEEFKSKKFNKVEVFVLEQPFTSFKNMPFLDFIRFLNTRELYISGIGLFAKKGIDFQIVLEWFLDAEFLSRKESDEIFEEFWILHEKAKELFDLEAEQIFLDLLKELARISHSISQFREILSDLEHVENLNFKSSLQRILKVIWLYLHSVIRFGANKRLIALQLLSSVVDLIEEMGINTLKTLIETLANNKMERSKAKNLAEFFFYERFRHIKRLRNQSPLSHGKTEVDLTLIDWEDFIGVYERIVELLHVHLSIFEFLKKKEREDSREKDELREIIDHTLSVFNKDLLEDVRNLGSLVKNFSTLHLFASNFLCQVR